MFVAVSSWIVCTICRLRPAIKECSFLSISHESECKPLCMTIISQIIVMT
jgi:hypothetical protein